MIVFDLWDAQDLCFTSESHQSELGFVFLLAVFFSPALSVDQKAGLACRHKIIF